MVVYWEYECTIEDTLGQYNDFCDYIDQAGKWL